MAVQNNPVGNFKGSLESHFLNPRESNYFLVSSVAVTVALIGTLVIGLGILSAQNLLPAHAISPKVAYSMLAAAGVIIVPSAIFVVKMFKSKAQLTSKTEKIRSELEDQQSDVSQNTYLKPGIEASDGVVGYHYKDVWIVYQRNEAQVHTFPNAQDQLQFLQEARGPG